MVAPERYSTVLWRAFEESKWRSDKPFLELKAERDARPKAIAWCENDGETVFLCVRNIGLLGAFYATLNVKGPVHNAKRDGYAWWTHTNRQKTNITGLSQRPSSILCDVGRVRGPRSTLH